MRITESRLRRIIRQVINEEFTFGAGGGNNPLDTYGGAYMPELDEDKKIKHVAIYYAQTTKEDPEHNLSLIGRMASAEDLDLSKDETMDKLLDEIRLQLSLVK